MAFTWQLQQLAVYDIDILSDPISMHEKPVKAIKIFLVLVVTMCLCLTINLTPSEIIGTIVKALLYHYGHVDTEL